MTKVDITLFNRKARRNLGKQMKGKILGRNLPFTKSTYGTIENYNHLREEELKEYEHNPTKETSS